MDLSFCLSYISNRVEKKEFWMKYLIVILISLFSIEGSLAQPTLENIFIDNIVEEDTLYVNFSIASGEMGSTHQGLLIYKKGSELFGKFVLYNYGVSLLSNGLIKIHPNTKPIALKHDSLIAFFNDIKEKYFVIKKEWKLDSSQVEYLDIFFSQLLNYKPKGFSNASEYYLIVNRAKIVIVIDSPGKLKMQVELKKALKLN